MAQPPGAASKAAAPEWLPWEQPKAGGDVSMGAEEGPEEQIFMNQQTPPARPDQRVGTELLQDGAQPRAYHGG